MPGRSAAVLVVLLLVGACTASPETTPEPAGFADALPGPKMELQVVEAPGLGEVLADHQQFTLYRYEQDETDPPRSTCVALDCTLKWVPLMAAEVQRTTGFDAGLLGIVDRPEGTKQVTLNGHPLYRYVDDEQAGDAKGDGLGGVWFAVGPRGEKARG
ncbi:COG4315 family predicted lipoprotein [Lentzea sp. CA-135723]|uniref:COG4315 family predicted lipoprotein n=1 Tax=Lentzea sp. CA-135723 TaxID=3239950 RepID=UPI003D9212AA